jgi:DNA-binding MarR family transcriptional regulator
MARREALQKAIKEALERRAARAADGPQNTDGHDAPLEQRRRAPFMQRRLAEHDLVDEITTAAELIADARDWHGGPIYRTDGVWRVLAAVERSEYCLAIADLARTLRMRKQAAHELAHEAVRAGVVELAPNPQDKRILQLLLTPQGRAARAAARTAEEVWLATLLNGLDDLELAATMHVVRVIRRRLERDARELERHKAEQSRRAKELRHKNFWGE